MVLPHDIWQCLQTLVFTTAKAGEGLLLAFNWGEARDPDKHPTMNPIAPQQRIIWPKNVCSAKVKKIQSSENMDQYPLILDKRVFILFRLFLQLPGLQGLWNNNLHLMLLLRQVLVAYTRIPYPSGP